MEHLNNGLYAIGIMMTAGFGALVHLCLKIFKVLERIETELKKQ